MPSQGRTPLHAFILRIIVLLVVVSLLAIILSFIIVTEVRYTPPHVQDTGEQKTISSQSDHDSNYVQIEPVTSLNPMLIDSTNKSTQVPMFKADVSVASTQSRSPTPQTSDTSTTDEQAYQTNVDLKQTLKALYQILNPFRVLGFYRRGSFANLTNYTASKKDEKLNFRGDADYCNYSDLYNMLNPQNIYSSMNFISDYDANSIVGQVMEKIGRDMMPELSQRTSQDNEVGLDTDLRATMFFMEAVDFHTTQKVGENFLCASQMYNHIPGSSLLVRRDLFVGAFNDYTKKFLDKPYCFNKDSFFPKSYRLNDETECKEFFDLIKGETYLENKKNFPIQFIIKKGSHRAKKLALFDNNKENELNTDYKSGEKCGELGTILIAQKYIVNPLLLDKTYKFDLRVYMLIASVEPLIVYYHDGYLRVSASEYKINSKDKVAHLNNLPFLSHEIEGVGNDTVIQHEAQHDGIWTLEQFQQYLLKSGKIEDSNWVNNSLRPQLKKAYYHLSKMAQSGLWKHTGVYELFGLDFMFDDKMNLWFLEANASPELASTTMLKDKMLSDMIMNMFEIQYSYLRSKLKRLFAIVYDYQTKSILDLPMDLGALRKEFFLANKNSLEPEFNVERNNTWQKIIDENLKGSSAYMGIIEEECLG